MDLDCMILLHYHQTGEWLPDVWAKEKEKANKASDPCGDRKCDQCEIGGCDHGIEVR